MNEFIMGLLSKTFNMTDAEVAEAFFTKTDDDKLEIKEDALELALSKDAERVTRIKDSSKTDTQAMFDKGYQKGQKESLSRLEKDFKESTGFEQDLQGIELFKAYADSLKDSKVKLSDDEFKVDKRFLEAERAWKAQMDESVNSVKSEYEEKLNDYSKKEKISKVSSDAKNILSSMNPILSDNQKVRENQVSNFLGLFKNGYDYELDNDGNHVIMSSGKRLEDAHGNRITFESFVQGKAKENFDFKVQDGKKGTGNDGLEKKTFNFPKFENDKEYMEAYNNAPDDETRDKIFESYNNQEK